MAITIISDPNSINSAYNPNQWVIDSDNKTQLGFRYVVNLYNTSNDLITKFTLLPRPNDGYGEFDLSKKLQEQLDIIFNQGNVNQIAFDAVKYKFDYKIKFGEEYIVNWTYTDTEFISFTETKCISTTTPPFAPGDTVVVVPNNVNIRPTFQGLYNVLNVNTNDKYVSFNVPWQTTPLNPGIIKYADNRKTEFTETDYTSIFTVIKTSIPFNEWTRTFVKNTYLSGNSGNKLLTNFKDNYYINTNQDIFIPFYYEDKYYINFEKNDEIITLLIGTDIFRFVNITPKFELNVDGDMLFDNNLKSYKVWFSDEDDNQLTNKMNIKINRNCAINEISLLFEDRLGSLTSFAFEAMNTKNITVTKEVYNKPLDLSNNYYDLSNASGIKTSTINYDEIITLRTRSILNREQDQYFEELITSGNVWIKIDDVYQRVNVITTGATILNKKQTGLRRREIEIEFANKNKINY